jgi:hypothetical protein
MEQKHLKIASQKYLDNHQKNASVPSIADYSSKQNKKVLVAESGVLYQVA